MRLLRSFQYPTPIRLGLYRLAPVGLCRNDVPVYSVGCRLLAERCRHVRVALEVMTGCE